MNAKSPVIEALDQPVSIGDLDTQSLKEKLELLQGEVARREAASRLRKAIDLQEQAQAMGFVSLAEAARVISGAAVPDRSQAIYVNPSDKTQTWSGRGRKPKWVHAHLNAGRPIEDLVPVNRRG